MLYWHCTGKPSTPKLGDFWGLYLAIGFCLAINGLILVYSSIPQRTPGIIQALLLNTGFLWSLPTAKMFVHEKSKYEYCRWPPIIGISFSIYGIIMAILPSIMETVEKAHGRF